MVTVADAERIAGGHVDRVVPLPSGWNSSVDDAGSAERLFRTIRRLAA
jgi:hypothetical protein